MNPIGPVIPESPAWRLVGSMATAQLVSWGTLTYSFSLLVIPMEAELGWSRTALNGALSLGSLLAAWSEVGSLPAFYLIWERGQSYDAVLWVVVAGGVLSLAGFRFAVSSRHP